MSLQHWLAVNHLPNVGAGKIFRWLEYFETIENLFHATKDEWRHAGIDEAHCQALQQPNWRLVEKELAWANQPNHHLISIADSDYPPLLKEISVPPLLLYVKGDKKVLHLPQLAIVGSRRASPLGIKAAEQFAYALSEMGLAITSGLALGIDAASHRGALNAKGVTIGIMGTGLNHIYPAKNRALADDIIQQGGAIVSEFPLDTLAHATHFPRRNRIISGLSLGVLVVEAAIKSGSLITARYASEQGREVFAIPGSIQHSQARGCHYLIQQGAKLVESPTDITEELQIRLGKKSKPALTEAKTISLTPQEAYLLGQIEYAVTPLDVIILRTGLTAPQVSSILLSLELYGLIESIPGGFIRMSKTNEGGITINV